ncbi:PAS domain-containing protein [Streptomyces sp. NPDC049541]|uniref:PAS domain-containing protein n=1 Tax=Streptomyces sp. NPDC049541 TaxID=3365594 RepID=UPI003794965E
MTGLIRPHEAGPEQPEQGRSRSGQGIGPGSLTAGRATAVLDERMRFIGWSPEAEALFGHRPDEVLGRSADAILASQVPPILHEGPSAC